MNKAIDWNNIVNQVNDPRLVILPLGPEIDGEELKQKSPGGRIFVCDAYINNIEQTANPIVGGFQDGQLINIDHHADDPRMKQIISSTPLAIDFVKQSGPAGSGDVVVINHFDCDSVLSAAIMLGILPPDPILADAAIAADHTGDANAIADLLQPLDRLRNFQLSIRSLAQTMSGQPLDPEVEQRLNNRLQERNKARDIVKQGRFHQLPGGVAWTQLDARLDGAFFPSLLPQAILIMIASPMPDNKPGLRMSIRLGLSAPPGFTLHDLGINQLDPMYGGRWNAGSNNRGGGTNLSPEQYAKKLDGLLSEKLDKFRRESGH